VHGRGISIGIGVDSGFCTKALNAGKNVKQDRKEKRTKVEIEIPRKSITQTQHRKGGGREWTSWGNIMAVGGGFDWYVKGGRRQSMERVCVRKRERQQKDADLSRITHNLNS